MSARWLPINTATARFMTSVLN